MNFQQILLLVGFSVFILGFTRRFPGFAIKKPVSLIVALAGLGLGGLLTFFVLPVELMPNASYGVITITTPVRGGMSPNDIENLVTKPIEEAVGSVGGIKDLFSNSKQGKSVVSVEFDPGTNMEFATLDIREKFSKVKGLLPREIESPIIAHYRESDIPIYIFSLSSAQNTPEQLRTLVDPSLKEKLMRVKGVANVDIAGGRERKIIIDVDRNRLASFGMDIRTVVDSIEKSNINVRGGALDTTSKSIGIRTLGQYISVPEVGNTVVGLSSQGTLIRVKDVGLVKDSYLEQESVARLNSESAVTIYLQKESGANTVQVVKNVKKILKEFKTTLPANVELIEISDQGDAILNAIHSVQETLVVGMIFVVLVLGYFLGFRPGLLVAFSIPMATLISFVMMYIENLTLNIMTLSGLTLGMGLLVDNSIVMLEVLAKTYESLKEEMKSSALIKKETWLESIQEASEKVAPAIIVGNLTMIVVFVPFFLLSKKVQLLYAGMAITIISSLLASLFVAHTTVPGYLSAKGFGLFEEKATRLQQKLSNFLFGFNSTYLVDRLHVIYANTLPWVFARKKQVLLTMGGMFLASLLVFQFFVGKNFSMGEEKNEFIIFAELPSGTRLEIADKVAKSIEEAVRADKKIASSLHTVTTRLEGWSGKIYVSLNPKNRRKYSTEEIIEILRPQLKDLGKADNAFVYFSSPQEGQELVVNVYGEDEKVTADYAMQVAGLLEKTKGFKDTKVRYRPGRPEVIVRVDSARAALFGLSPTVVGNVLHAQTRGLRATYFREKGEEFETIVRLQVDQRESLEAIKSLLIPTPRGTQVQLAQIARFDFSLEPSDIWRHNKMRMIQVSSNISKMSVQKAGERVTGLLKEIPFNTDYWAELGGDYQDQVNAEKEFYQAVLMTTLLVFGVLACFFESLLQPLILFVSVPLTMIGITAALFFTHTPVTMGVVIGILMTGGIAVNNAILLVTQFNQTTGPRLVDALDRLVLAGQERLRPILMTTVTAILGLLPMALDHRSGAELWRPMAITTIGGLMCSFLLTLYILPLFISYAERKNNPTPHKEFSADEAISGVLEGENKWKESLILKMILVTCLSAFVVSPTFAETTGTPQWVGNMVNTRVKDLLSQGKSFEAKKDWANAIDRYLEAVSLAPSNQGARAALLRANEKDRNLQNKKRKKKQTQYVRWAEDTARSKRAWKDALDGKVFEAERWKDKQKWARSYDVYLTIISEAPTYLPALKGLENLQGLVRRKLDVGGGFSSDEDKQVVTGFWFYSKSDWANAITQWKPVVENSVAIKKWGKEVSLGEYLAKAAFSQVAYERQQKIDALMASGMNHFREGHLDEAQADFQSALDVDPKNVQAKEYVKMIPDLKEQAKQEMLSEIQAKEINTTLSDALDFYLKGYLDEAESKVQLILAQSPQFPQALTLENQIREARGVPRIPTLEETQSAEQAHLDELFSNGIVAFAEGRLEDAKKSWQEVLQKDPTHDKAKRALQKISSDAVTDK